LDLEKSFQQDNGGSIMKKVIVNWIGFVLVLSILLAACSPISPNSQAEQPKSAESVVTEEPTEEIVATEEPTADSVAKEEPEITGLPIGEIAPDFTLSDGDGNMVNLAEELQENEQVVIVFYIGQHCGICMSQLRQIENDRARYEEKGAQVIAIAVQKELEVVTSARVSTAQFPILADSEHSVTEAYGVLDDGLSNPSVFIINKDGQIVWSEITHLKYGGCGLERVPSETILEKLG
jgi:peroxiredoxin